METIEVSRSICTPCQTVLISTEISALEEASATARSLTALGTPSFMVPTDYRNLMRLFTGNDCLRETYSLGLICKVYGIITDFLPASIVETGKYRWKGLDRFFGGVSPEDLVIRPSRPDV